MAFITSEPVECDNEPLHLSGQIQSHGILVALQEPEMRILQISENVVNYFGIPALLLLGEPLEKLLSKKQTELICSYSKQKNNPFELKGVICHDDPNSPNAGHRFNGALHRNKSNVLILELEPYLCNYDRSRKSINFYSVLQSFMADLRQVEDVLGLAQLLATKVKQINGFDRVMVYQFDPINQSGKVIAEAKEPHLDSYLDLHYPASDIPKKVRDIFAKNWVRFIPDIAYQPVPIIATSEDEPLDLTYASLRSVAAGHLDYLENMGVQGSMSISIRNENQLWGMIACHNCQPKYVDYQTRKACELVGQFVSIELLRQQEIETTRYQIRVKSLQEELQQAFSDELDFVEQVIDRNQDKLLTIVCAQGAAILFDDHLTLIGKTPTGEQIQSLIAWFLKQKPKPEPIFFTNALSQIYPQAAEITDVASGVAIASITIKQKSHHIIWFRPEQLQTVNWAGASSNPITITEDGEKRYTPRQSFKLWVETVRNQSLPWQPLEIKAASEMRKILMQAILDSAQFALERTAELEKAAKEAAIASRAKSEFLAKMSHELRTPLTAILGFTNLIARDRSLIATHKEHLEIISRSGEHLLSLINDVLEISKIESGQVDLLEYPFDLYRLIYSIRDMLAIRAVNKGLELHFHIAPMVPQYVHGDAGKLRQILLNIVGNALKFTSAGHVTMKISAKQIGDKSESIAVNAQWKFSFEVSDSGIGISEHDLKNIFDTFKQTDHGKYLQGSGLGLSISRQFARMMAGDVSVSSKLGEGSNFLVEVQMMEVEANVVAALKDHELVIALKAGQPAYRILVVDDVLEIRQLLVNLLESVGLEVRAAENGAVAIAIYQEWLPHLILMDIGMPVMDGYEAIRQIRAIPAETSTKIIALTASAFDSDRRAALEAGCDDFVVKPFTEAIVFDKIGNLLGAEYVYAESLLLDADNINLQSKNSLNPLNKIEMQSLDRELVSSIHQATLLLDESTLHKLIDLIPVKHKSIAQILSIMVDNLQFESILKLTQP